MYLFKESSVILANSSQHNLQAYIIHIYINGM